MSWARHSPRRGGHWSSFIIYNYFTESHFAVPVALKCLFIKRINAIRDMIIN